MDDLTVVSHILLAFNSSVNLLLYCVCDKHFWVIAQKKLKMWFVWPLTLRREFVSLESVTLSCNKVVVSSGNDVDEDEDDVGRTTIQTTEL